MLHKKLLLSLLAATLTLVGCSDGDQGDNVTITNEIGGGGPTDPPDPGPGGDCEGFVETSFASCQELSGGGAAGTLTGTIDQDYLLNSDLQWRLSGTVIVGTGNQTVASDADVQAIKDAGVVLTIEAGTDVRAFDDGSLLVTRGSQLVANGTASSPITFSSLDSDFNGLGEWGGVIIQGFAPQFGAGGTGPCFGSGTICNVEGEGGTEIAVYGGNEPDDNSGSMRYVRIAEGGLVAGPNNEINGLTLQGVGYGTQLEFIQVHNNLDDGIEWFGGTASVRYAVLTGNDDDDIDFDEGFQGNIQYAIVVKSDNAAPVGSNDPRAIEANSSDDEYVPETEAVIANVTILGGNVNNSDAGRQPGMRLRGAVNTNIFNTAVREFDRGCIRIDDANIDGTGMNNVPSVVNLTNILNDCDAGTYDGSSRGPADSEDNVLETGWTISGTYAINEDEAVLASAPTIDAVDNGDSFVFDQTAYIGAVDPAAATGWWEGWIIPGSLESTPPDESPDFVSCDLDASTPNCTITGTIDEDYTFVRGVQYRLDGEVIVGDGNQFIGSQSDFDRVVNSGVTLTIEPGVDVRAFDDGSLLVTRGSKLMAVGTAASPITFSSLADEDFDGLGEWGGVIIQGFAPQFGAGGTGACFNTGEIWCNVEGEGGTVIGRYGGNVPDDDSGMVRYVRIAEGGLVAGPNNEINGLTMQGVGHGTTIEYVQVHNNLDDGLEWFGGTVNARYVVLTGNDDDDIDFDEGYQGNIQFAIVVKSNNSAPVGSNDPRAIEANSSDDEFVPETEGALANVLIIGGQVNNAGSGQPGMRLRGALTTRIYNTSVSMFDTRGCIRIDDADTNGDGNDDEVSTVELYNVLGDCTAGYYDGSSRGPADVENNAGDPDGIVMPLTVDAAYALEQPEALVTPPMFMPVNNGSGFTFEATDYVGAVEPGTSAADAWWADWIIPGSL